MTQQDQSVISTNQSPDGAESRSAAVALAGALHVDLEALPIFGSRNAFSLAGSGRAWLVVEGALDLFLADPVDPEASNGESGGRRRFIATVPAGQLCIGFAPDAPVPIAAPGNGSRICEVALNALLALAVEDHERTLLGQAIAEWVKLLAQVAYDAPPPAARVVREAGRLMTKAGDQVQAVHGILLWVASPAGAIRVAADPDPAPTAGVHLAMTNHRWLTASVDGEWDLMATDAWLTAGAAAASLAQLHSDTIGRIRAQLARCASQDRERVKAAGWAAANRFTQALKGLAGVLQRGRRRVVAGRSTTPAIAALQVVAEYLDLSLPEEALLEPALTARDPLLALAQRAGMALRTVELAGAWWRDEHGPLVATRRDSDTLAVLLPRRGGDYECIDPLSGAAVRVDKAVAAALNTRARVLYHPFPEGPLSAKAIMLFGFRGSWREAFYVLALIITVGLISMVSPIFTGWILDPVIPQADIPQLLVLVIAVLIAGFTQQGFSLIQSLYLLRVEGRVSNMVQTAVWDRLLKLPASFFQGFSAGDLANRAMGVDAMRQQLSGSVLATVTHSVIGVFSLGLMVYYDWRLALASAIVVAIYAIITILSGRWVLRFSRDQLRLSGQIQGLLLQLLGAVSKLRVGGAERNAFIRWAGIYGHLQGISYGQQQLNNRLVVFKSAFQNLATMMIILVLAWQGGVLLAFYHTPETWADINNVKLQTLMPTAEFVPFYAAFGQFMSAAFGMASLVVQLTNIPAYYERFAPILSATPESVNGADPGVVRGDIAVNAVKFRYTPDGPLVLHGVSLQATDGEFIAIVGPSGAGKSSLVRLLLGFDPPESGSIFLDGADIARLDKRLMRQSFGVVLQNGQLLAGTIYQNIVAGAQLTRDQAMEAARLAGLEADITAMPMGLDTYLSEGATTLSGGQRQRLMIARAIVHRPKVIIFDEATSALDNLTQDIVTRSLETLNSTRIVIAHRLSTIIRADRIYVIDQGTVRETGIYESLMAQDGLFAAMARRQVI